MTPEELEANEKAFLAGEDLRPPTVEVARPDIAEPEKKRRGKGRPPGGYLYEQPGYKGAYKGARANNGQPQTLKGELQKRLPTDIKQMSDETVGVAISGAFAALGIFAGPHWRLFPQETRQYGETFGPLARLYGSEELAKWITILMCIPIIAQTVAPRVAIQQMVYKGECKKEEARSLLLNIKGMMAAEETLDADHQAKEGEAFLRAQVNAGMNAGADMKVQQIQTEGVVNGSA